MFTIIISNAKNFTIYTPLTDQLIIWCNTSTPTHIYTCTKKYTMTSALCFATLSTIMVSKKFNESKTFFQSKYFIMMIKKKLIL